MCVFLLQCGSNPSPQSQSAGSTTPSSPTPSTTLIQVSVQSPTNDASVTNPVTFSASAAGQSGITGWVIYMDNQSIYLANSTSKALTASVTLPEGQHTMSVRAADGSGAHADSPSFKISVVSTSADNPLPTPPATALVFNNIEETTDWRSCSDCAGGGSTTANYSTQLQSSPAMNGLSRQFYNGGTAWSNVLWYRSLGPHNSATNFLWDFYVYFDSTTAANLWTAEYDLYQSIGGFEFMIGSQCNFGEGHWDTWNQATGHWVPSSIPCERFSPDTWHHIQWYLQRVSLTQYRYDTVVVDGQAHTVNQTFSGSPVNWADTLGVQWQLDLNSTGLPANEWIEKVTLTIW
jgi:hypothetical protein